VLITCFSIFVLHAGNRAGVHRLGRSILGLPIGVLGCKGVSQYGTEKQSCQHAAFNVILPIFHFSSMTLKNLIKLCFCVVAATFFIVNLH
jgi:hypothetical protein